jgi:hypothetical protein
MILEEGETIRLLEPEEEYDEEEENEFINGDPDVLSIRSAKDLYDWYRPLPRIVMIEPTRELSQIWKKVEEKLKVKRDHFALVYESHYLPEEGEWDHDIQWVEARGRGKVGNPGIPATKTPTLVRLTPNRREVTQVCWTIDRTGEKGVCNSQNPLDLAEQVQNRFGGEEPLLFYEADGERYAIPCNSRFQERPIPI